MSAPLDPPDQRERADTYLGCGPLDAVLGVLFSPLIWRGGRLTGGVIRATKTVRTIEMLWCSLVAEVVHALGLGLVRRLLLIALLMSLPDKH